MKSLLATLATLLSALGLGFGLKAQETGVDPAGPGFTLTITRPADGESFALGAEIPLRATAVDTGGAITRLEFLADGKVIGVSEIFTLVPIPPGTPVEHDWTWNDASFGRHELRVRARRSLDEIVTSAPVFIQVGQVKPVAQLTVTRPANGERLRVGQPAELRAEATDPRGLIETVEFFVNGTKVGTSVVQFCPPCEKEPCPLLPCALPAPGTTLTHRVQWVPAKTGEAVIEARATLADGISLKSEPVRALVQAPLPTVTVKTGQAYALEGDLMNRGEIVVERSGDLSRDLTVFFEISGQARRGADYRLVVNPCDDCDRPEVELTGDSLTFPAGEARIVLGVFAAWDGLLTVVESPSESLRFEVYTPPIPAVVGAEPPYLAGDPSVADLLVVDRRSPEMAEVMLVSPEPRTELALGAAHTLRALAVDPAGSIRRVEFLAGDVVIGVSRILTRDADIPGRLRVHELAWKPSAEFGPGEQRLHARATDAAGKALESGPVPVQLIVPDSDLPLLSIVPGKSPAYETGDLKSRTGSVIVRRTGGAVPGKALDFWLLVTGSATGGLDYRWSFEGFDSVVTPQVEGVFLPVAMPAGAAELELPLEALADELSEGAETVVVRLIESPLQTAIGGLLPVPPAYRIGEPATATLEIWDKPLEPPVVTLTVEGREFPAGATVKMSASATVPGLGIVGIVFLADGQVIGQVPYCCDTCRCLPPVAGAPFGATFAWTNPPSGVHRLTARALAVGNASWDSGPVTVRVGQVNAAASLVFKQPKDLAEIPEGRPLEIVVEATDPRGLIQTLTFFANGQKLGTSEVTVCPPCDVQPCPECLPPPLGATLTHRFVWERPVVGKYALEAQAVLASGAPLDSSIRVSITPAVEVPTVAVNAVQPFALEGTPLNYGELEFVRTGDLGRELEVPFELSGDARRGSDFWLELDPCDLCLRPTIELRGNSIRFGSGQATVRIGLHAMREDTLDALEPLVERARFTIPAPIIPAVVGAVPPYQVGEPGTAEVLLLDRANPDGPAVVLFAPERGAALALGGAHLLRAVAVDPMGSIRRVEFFAGEQLLGVSEILTREMDIPGKLRLHEFLWKPAGDLPPGERLLTARARTAGGVEVKSPAMPVKLTGGTELPVISITPGQIPAYESGDLKSRRASFHVLRRGGDLTQELHAWGHVTGTATWGLDYRWPHLSADPAGLPAFGTFIPLSIPAGKEMGEVWLEALPDDLFEGTETVRLRLIDPPLAAAGLLPIPPTYVIGQPNEAEVTIVDRKVELPSISLTLSAKEVPAGQAVVFTATAAHPNFGVEGIEFLVDGRSVGQELLCPCPEVCDCPSAPVGVPFTGRFEWKATGVGPHTIVARALIVMNNLLQSEPAELRVLGAGEPQLTIIAPTNRARFSLGDTVTIHTVGSDPEGLIGQVEFFANGLKLGETCTACVIDALLLPGAPLDNVLAWKPTEPGTYILTAVGQTARADRKVAAPPVIVTVGLADGPTLAITSPLNGGTFRMGETVIIDTVGLHPTGWVNLVEFYANGDKIGESCLACVIAGLIPPGRELHNQIEWKPAKPGPYVLTAVGRFTPDSRATTVPVNVRVLEASPGTLTIKSPADGAGVPADAPLEVIVGGSGRTGGFTDVALFVDGKLAGESHIRFIRPPRADEEVLHTFTVRLAPGSHQLVAQDLFDRTVKSPAINVLAKGTAARIVWNSPAPDARFPAGQPVTLEVTAVEPGGLLFEVEFLADGQAIGKSVFSCPTCRLIPGAEIPHRFVWADPPPGQHKLLARAVRADGTFVESDDRLVTIEDTVPPRAWVRRDLPERYQGGEKFQVHLTAVPPAGVAAWVVEERPPFALPTPGAPGGNQPFWQVLNTSHAGIFDPVTGKVKFGPFFDRESRVLTYEVFPNQAVELAEFAGLASADGASTPIGGDHVLRGTRRHPADRAPADDAISADELTAYAAAWKREQPWPIAPNPIPMDYVTRAAALWKAGENYREAAASGSPRDWINGLPTVPAAADALVVPLAGTAVRSRTISDTPLSTRVEIQVLAAPGSRAFAVEETLPEGQAPTDISAGGNWSAGSRTIRWGPFFAGASPTLHYTVGRWAGARGRVSFDGLSLPVHEAAGRPASGGGRLIGVDPLPDGSVQISLEAGALLEGAEFDLEVSGDLSRWSSAGAFAPEQSGGFVKDTGPAGAEVRFYRAVRRR